MIDLRDWGATEAEVRSSIAGDELIDGPGVEQGTRSIDITAEPAIVFDFLAQMGFGRAGWYSYDLLDNLGRTSARTINPEWVVSEAGASVPGGPIRFVAAVVERPSAYALQVPTRRVGLHTIDFTLAYRLDPVGDGTRLVSRARIRIDGPLGGPATTALVLGDGAMVRRQLLGLRERCESLVEISRSDPSLGDRNPPSTP